MNGTTPVLILTVAGTMVIQQGLGQNTPTYQVTNASDGFASDADAAVDAGSGQVVASWGLGADQRRRRHPDRRAERAVSTRSRAGSR